MLNKRRPILTRLLMIALIGWSAVGGEVASAVAQPPANQHALTSEAAQSQLARSVAAMTSLDLEQVEVAGRGINS